MKFEQRIFPIKVILIHRGFNRKSFASFSISSAGSEFPDPFQRSSPVIIWVAKVLRISTEPFGGELRTVEPLNRSPCRSTAGPGLEPGIPAPKAGVLPLHHPAIYLEYFTIAFTQPAIFRFREELALTLILNTPR